MPNLILMTMTMTMWLVKKKAALFLLLMEILLLLLLMLMSKFGGGGQGALPLVFDVNDNAYYADPQDQPIAMPNPSAIDFPREAQVFAFRFGCLFFFVEGLDNCQWAINLFILLFTRPLGIPHVCPYCNSVLRSRVDYQYHHNHTCSPTLPGIQDRFDLLGNTLGFKVGSWTGQPIFV
jgi:hypothetical protein